MHLFFRITIMKEHYDRIKRLLARSPKDFEQKIIAQLWSEECSYKSSKAYLSTLPGYSLETGLIELGDNLALAMSVASDFKNNSRLMLEARLKRELCTKGGEVIACLNTSYENYNNILAAALVTKNNITQKAEGIKNRVLCAGIFNPEFDLDKSENLKQAIKICILEQLATAISSVGIGGLALQFFMMANKASTGLLLNIDELVPTDNYGNVLGDLEQIILSEQPERIILIADPSKIIYIKSIFENFGLFCVDIGRVTGDGIIRLSFQGQEIINLAATLIWENAPRYRHNYQSILPKAHGSKICRLFNISLEQALLTHASCDKKALVSIGKAHKNIAISSHNTHKILDINAFEASKRAVWQGALEVSIMGTFPRAIALSFITNSLTRENSIAQFKQAIDGIGQAALDLFIPVTSSHINIHENIASPALLVNILGVGDEDIFPKISNYQEKLVLVVLGEIPTDYTGAEALFDNKTHDIGVRSWDSSNLNALCEVAREFAHYSRDFFAKVIGRGGLIAALYELMAQSHKGICLKFGNEWLAKDLPVVLLSEDSPRIFVCLPERNLNYLIKLCAQLVPIHHMGYLTGKDLLIYHENNLIYKTRK